MNQLPVTHPLVHEFILAHERTDTSALMLRAARHPELPMKEVVQQIQARQKARKKLPEWYAASGIVYPPVVSMEQCSSEATAKFKAGLVNGETLADLTGGFGIDCFYLSCNFEKAYYIEQNQQLAELARHNYNLLGAKNIAVQHTTALSFLQETKKKLSLIYLDPARRDENQRKVFLLQDCQPDVTELQPLLLAKAEKVMVKAAPVMDIDQAVKDLQKVESVYIVSHLGECREVLYLLSEKGGLNPTLHAVNIMAAGPQIISFTRKEEQSAQAEFALPGNFIYEPNPSVLKAGAFKVLCTKYPIKKLHPSSHLYTSDNQVADFPGRAFKLLGISRANKTDLKQYVLSGKANLTVRNFPETVDVIRKRTGLKEGGDQYIFATTDMHQKPVLLICQKA